MMSTSSSGAGGEGLGVPVTSFSYRDMGSAVLLQVKETGHAAAGADQDRQQPPTPGLNPTEMEDLLTLARVEAVAQTEGRLKAEYETRSEVEVEKIRHAIELFQVERKDYFSRVEADVVQLALAIASKILHREVQVDPMLVAALVRVAIDKLHDGSSVTVRVSPAEAAKWRGVLANPLNGSTIEVTEDAHLGVADCILETELGSANFSIDAQMKEVEQGFFDLLAQRPVIK